jgi:hypothetical protein
MQNPFAIAVQWPDAALCYLVHMQRPYFTAALFETTTVARLFVTWAPSSGSDEAQGARVFRSAADFCRARLGQADVPIEFVERRHGYHLPRFLMAQTATHELFIVEPEHAAPLVEVRKGSSVPAARNPEADVVQRFDIVTQWRLAEMRKYYQQYVDRQRSLVNGSDLARAH